MKQSLVVILLVAILLIASVMWVSADRGYPEGVEIFEIPSGQWCVLVEGEFECYCPCEVQSVCEPTSVPTDEPNPTPPPNPTPTDFPDPTKTPKPKCNRGLGNGSEGCDPGNSGGKPGSAGEDNE